MKGFASNVGPNEQRFFAVAALLAAVASLYVGVISVPKASPNESPPLPKVEIINPIPKIEPKQIYNSEPPQQEAKKTHRFYTQFGEWWEVSSPNTPQELLSAESDIWKFIESHRGSCQPLLDYKKWYPSGPHNSEVVRRLKNRRLRSEVRQKITEEVFADSNSTTTASENFDQEATCTSMRPQLERVSLARCDGAKAARELFSKDRSISCNIDEKSVQCNCSKSIFGGWSCEMKLTRISKWKKYVNYDLENCRI